MNEVENKDSVHPSKTDDTDTPGKYDKSASFVSSGHRRINLEIESGRLTEEINFLRDRLEKIRDFKTPNPIMFKAYETMLADRESLLRKLHNNSPNDCKKTQPEQQADKQAVLDISY